MSYTVKKLIDIATELHQKPEVLIEYLKTTDLNVPKKPNTFLISNWKVEEEIYLALVKKFDPEKWFKLELEKKRALEIQQREEKERLRKEELEKISRNLYPQFIQKESVEETKTEVKIEELPSKPIEDNQQKTEIVAPVEDIPEKETDTIPPIVEPVENTEDSSTEPTPVKVDNHIPLPEIPRVNVISKGTVQTPPKEKGVKKETKTKSAEQKEPAKETVKEKTKKKTETKISKEVAAENQSEQFVEEIPTKKEQSKKWKRKTLSPEEQEEIVRTKSKAIKERVAVASLPEIIRKKPKPKKVDAQAVESTLRQTIAAISEGTKRFKKKHKKVIRDDGVEIETNVLRLTEYVTTAELASFLEVTPAELIKKSFTLGSMITQNQRLDKDLIVLLASEYNVEVEFITDEEEEEEVEVIDISRMKPRQPVVTVMGHVDHGKTTLLDYLRKTNVAAREYGGITQHIGAYEVEVNGKKITFLDTPGHKAFTAMRARGAQITDIVVLVVAADDQVMPQTIEAIDHAKAANVPIVVAINKIDKPNANPELIKRQLSEHGILIEEWGGKYQCAEISAKFGKNIDGLLEEILLAAEIAELKADWEGKARGVVLEARIEKGRGTVATVLIQHGILKIGDVFVAGQQYGRVRSLLNEANEKKNEAYPGQPIQVVGFDGIPQAGDKFIVYESDREAREVAQRRQQQQREQTFRTVKRMTLEQLSKKREEGYEHVELNIVLKGDADGSVEVIADSLMKLSGKEVTVNIIHRSVGPITDNDVLLAVASHAIIIGFHVHPNVTARELAEKENVDIRIYRTIYQVEDDIRNAISGLLKPKTKEILRSTIEVREIFKISRVGTVAGCYVSSGSVARSHQVRLIRDGREIWSGTISNLQRFKDSVREVKEGFECGISLNGFNDIKVGDRIESYEIVEEARQYTEQVV
ncbi:MAG: translation initiation factor IF-2 [bacterium]|nr:translation initiation factor IF-2 [bacterium]